MSKKMYKEQYSFSQILSESWQLYKTNFKDIFFITLIIYIPINIVLYFIPVDENMESFRAYMRVIQVLEGFFGIIATMAVAWLIKSSIDGKTATISESLQKSVSRWIPAIWTSFLMGILFILLFLLLIIPGVIYIIYWSFATYIVLFKNISGKKALDESKSIVKGRWRKVFRYSLGFGLIAVIVGIIAGIPTWFMSSNIVTSVISTTVIDIAVSYFTVAYTVFFLNFDATKKV